MCDRRAVDVNVKGGYRAGVRNSHQLQADFAANPPAAAEEELTTISQMAAEFGVTARALRFYEDKGLVTPERRGQTRLYSAHDRARLAFVLRGKRLGWSLSEVKQFLDLYALGDGQQPLRMRALRAAVLDRAAKLRAQRADIDIALADLMLGLEWIEQRLSAPALALVFLESAKAYDAQARRCLDIG